MRDVLLVSPHNDDVAYSVTGLLLSGQIPACRCVLVTLFSESAFAPYATVTGIEEITALRRAEDSRFARMLAVERLDLGGAEARLRLGIGPEQVFEPMQEPVGTCRTEIAFRELCRSRSWRLVLAPLGVGGHVDHVTARRWVERHVAAERWFYEDLPYAGELDDAAYSLCLADLTCDCAPLLTPDTGWLVQKLALLRGFESQVAEKDIRSVIRSTHRLGGERAWRQIA